MLRFPGALAWCLWLATAAMADTGAWTPDAWATFDTIDLVTQDPGADAYAFPVWLVVLDGQAYVRLGPRAAGRVRRNVDAPYIGVKLAHARFPRVRCEPVPADATARVAAAMAKKYRSDIVVRCMPHPLTCRLVPG